MDLVLAYSKHPDVLADLDHVVRQLETGLAEPAPKAASVRSSGRVARVWALTDRLSDAQVHELVAAFRAGTPQHKLAAKHSISLSSVKRLLRQHGGRRCK